MRVRVTLANVALACATLLLSAGAGAQQSIGANSAGSASATTPADLERQGERARIEHQRLESDRLRVEIDKLKAETRDMQPWYGSLLGSLLGVVFGFAGIVVPSWFGLKAAMKARLGVFDTRLYEERLKAYGAMVAATKALALHFPEHFVDQDVCARAGRLLRHEFFGLTGTLLTDAARRRYMALSHALTQAARAERLNVPSSDDDYARWVSDAQLVMYRRILRLTVGPDGKELDAKAEMVRCAGHRFGELLDAAQRQLLAGEPNPDEPGPADRAAAELFRDFVVLQFASSRLRTELGRDISGRRTLAELVQRNSDA